jgi:hypothetical protein
VGTISVLIFQSGILAVGGQLPNQASTTTAKNLLYYVIAFVVGYREDIFRQLIRRLADVILTPPPEGGAGAAPVIESVDPSQAVAGQETEVTLTGTGFTGTASVRLNGDDIDFVTESDTQMTITIPNTAPAGDTHLVVKTKQGAVTTSFTIT